MKRLLVALITSILPVSVLLLSIQTSWAANATWLSAPPTGDWNSAANWTAGGPPNGPSDTATFGLSNQTMVSLSANTEANGIVFNAAGSAFTITASPTLQLTISGVGISNNSGITQNFATAVDGAGNVGTIAFTNSATAGSLTAVTNNGSTVSGGNTGITFFLASSTAGNGTFTNNGSTVTGALGGSVSFSNTATAGNANFTNNRPAVSGAFGGIVSFHNSSTAANGTFISNGSIISGEFGGQTTFQDSSTAGNGNFTSTAGTVNGGGVTAFQNTSTAGNGTFTTEGAVVSRVTPGFIFFHDTSTAGNGTFTNNGSAVSGASGGLPIFYDTSTAGNGTFINKGAAVSGASGGATLFTAGSTAGNGNFTNTGATVSGAFGGVTLFQDSSSADNGIFTNQGGMVSGGFGAGYTDFSGTSTAASGIFTNNGGTVSGAGGSLMDFHDTSTAGNGTFINNDATVSNVNGGGMRFFDDSNGGTARVEVFGVGDLDISAHNAPGVTIGSIEGSGAVFLGANNLTVGSDNLSTTFSGVIQDGGANGSFTKVGAGILTFEGGASNDYIADTVTLSIANGSTINLNFTGTPDTVASLVVNGVTQVPGVYGSAASGAPHQLPEFAGPGTILVPAAPTPTPTATPGPPVITSPLAATGTVGLPFTYQFTASGATSLGVSNLAPGLTFSTSLGAITGIPTTAGIFPVGLSATNSQGTTPRTLTLTVQPAPTSGPVIISSTCATARTGRPFSFQLQAIGGSSATHFTVDVLPPGLNLDPPTGFISGTPTSDGSFGLAVTAIDGAAITHATVQLTFTSDPAVPIITSAGSAVLTPGQFFSYIITADANGTFGYIGTDGIVYQGPSSAGLPAGLRFDGFNTISGVFNEGPISSVKTEATDHKANRPGTTPTLNAGIITNVQLFATDPSGTGTFPLISFIAAKDTVQISTRLAVGTDSNVLIGGFIIQGTGTTRALIRAIGPSLTQFGVPNALQDPMLELRDGGGSLLGSNDNWRDTQENAVIATGIAPTDDHESTILAYLSPGSYTAIVSGKNNTTGNALVEVYDLGTAYPLPPDNARLANISTRGFVDTGDSVIIGGFIIHPQAPATNTTVIIRAIGPSLTQFGIANALADPTLELRDSNGMLLIENNDWQDDPTQAAQLTAAGLAPTNQLESGIAATEPLGPYTAIVRGKDNTTGVALVEVYALQGTTLKNDAR